MAKSQNPDHEKVTFDLKKAPPRDHKNHHWDQKERLDIISQPDPKNHIDLKSEPGDWDFKGDWS